MKFKIRLRETTTFNINIILNYLLKHKHLPIFIYDIKSYSSYMFIRRIIRSIDKPAKLIVGNKVDLNANRCVMIAEGKDLEKNIMQNF